MHMWNPPSPPPRAKKNPWNYLIYNFGRPFLGHHYYKLNCLIHATKKREKILQFHYRTCIRTPAPLVIKFTLLEDLACHHYVLSFG